MRSNKLLGLLYLFLIPFSLFAQKGEETLEINNRQNSFALGKSIGVLNDLDGNLHISEVINRNMNNQFLELEIDKKINPKINLNAKVHWIKFRLENQASGFEEYKLSVAYTDYVSFFIPTQNGSYVEAESGDLFELAERPVKNGFMVFHKFLAPHNEPQTYYVRLESTTKISSQFRKVALRSLVIYPEKGFEERFLSPRFYQAFFYGAILIMVFYNLFIFFSLGSKDYLYYVLYLFGLIVFFSSNGGYIMEVLLPNQPRLDLYIRFLSTPFLLFFYLQFSQAYLNTKNLTKLHQVINVLKGIFVLSFLLMFPVRQWMLGRSIFIFAAIFSYLFILFVTYKEIRRGYSPAKYFMLANILLIIGAVLFAMPRIFGNVQNPLTQYGVQLGVLLEVALFSVGLADRINVARRDLAEQTLANERLQLEKEREKQKIIEEKAAELEQKVIERTREVVEKKDEIEKQNKHITDSIRYAERIQNALLGSEEYIMDHFSDGFIFFKPKDIVSGDFYWFGRAGDKKVLIAADCTGHGVPGAFMTMMGNSFLNDIVSEDGVYEPSQILLMLDRKIKESLQGSGGNIQDGMDMGILTVDEDNQKILYSGAKNPLCRVRNGEIERIKGSIFAVGGSDFGREKEYKQYEFPIVEGDI